MSYNINWASIFSKYEDNPSEVIEQFHRENSIDWSKFDSSIGGRGEIIFAEEFAKQQGWECGRLHEEQIRVIEHIIVADVHAPEETLFAIAREENWEHVSSNTSEYPLQVAILTHPHTSERVLREMCLGFSIDFHLESDFKVLQCVFEHSCLTQSILNEFADRLYGGSAYDEDRIIPYAPEYLLHRELDMLLDRGYISGNVEVLVMAPNASQELLMRIAEYVLESDKSNILDDEDQLEQMVDIIKKLLANPKTPEEFTANLKELKGELVALM